MIYFYNLAKHIACAVEYMADENCLCGTNNNGYLDIGQIELVYVNSEGKIVGTEAEDYQPKSGEQKALLFG